MRHIVDLSIYVPYPWILGPDISFVGKTQLCAYRSETTLRYGDILRADRC